MGIPRGLLGTIIVGIGMLTVNAIYPTGRNTQTNPPVCETYQGNHWNKADSEMIYVFDPQTFEERRLRPSNFSLSGNPEWENQLETGKQYSLRVEGGNRGILVSFRGGCSSSLEQEVQNPEIR